MRRQCTSRGLSRWCRAKDEFDNLLSADTWLHGVQGASTYEGSSLALINRGLPYPLSAALGISPFFRKNAFTRAERTPSYLGTVILADRFDLNPLQTFRTGTFVALTRDLQSFLHNISEDYSPSSIFSVISMTTLNRCPAVGEYVKASASASRSPCPVLNALSNHGYIERTGRNIYQRDLYGCLKHVGMSPLLGSVFAIPTYFPYQDPTLAYLKRPASTWTRLWNLFRNPYTFFDYFGCWKVEQINEGQKYLNLEDLASHGAIEHDVSLSRRDAGQKQGNNDLQPDLVDEMMEYSEDGKTLTIDDLGQFIRARIKQQLRDNPNLIYGPSEHQVNCGQIALMMGCFGDGKTIPVSYVRAIFEDERLPIEEGWKKRSWWTMGLVEFFGAVKNLVVAVGLKL